MQHTIIQQLDGVELTDTGGIEPITSTKSDIDDGNSSIYGTSIFAQYNDEGERIGEPKPTDDKIVIGYSSQGLPFLIVVDGFYGSDPDIRNKIFGFIDEHVTSLVAEYALKLSQSKDANETIKSLIKKIYELHPTHKGIDFTMSIAVAYEKDDQQYCAGFGIGDTGIVLRQAADGRLVQLAYNTETDAVKLGGKKDGFDDITQKRFSKSADEIIKRNNVFNVSVKPGDELLGYTSLCDLEQKATEATLEKDVKAKLKLDPSLPIQQDRSLFDQVIEQNKQKFDDKCDKAKKDKKSKRFGDDCMIGSVVLPSAELQEKLQIIVRFNTKIYEKINDIEQYVEQLKTAKHTKPVPNKSATLSHFIDDLKKTQDPQELKQLLDDFKAKREKYSSTYKIINKGQDFFTRFFKAKTTSMKKIEALHKEVNKLAAKNDDKKNHKL